MARSTPPRGNPALAGVTLDRSSPLPLYQQIKQQLARIAGARRDSPGRFHSETEIARAFGVSRMTVRQAIEELVDEGVLRRRRGAGTFVTLATLEERFTPGMELEEAWSANAGEMRVEPLVWEMRPCPADFAALLGVEEGAAIRYLSRLRLAGTLPVAVDHRYIPADLAAGIGPRGVRKSMLLQLWNLLELSHGELELDAAAAGQPESRALGIAVGAPLIRRRVRYFAESGRTVMAGVSLYRADLVRYSIHVPLSRAFRSTLDPPAQVEEAPREARLRREVGPPIRGASARR